MKKYNPLFLFLIITFIVQNACSAQNETVSSPQEASSSGVISSLIKDIKQVAIQKGKTGISALSDIASQTIDDYLSGKEIDIAETAGKVVEAGFVKEQRYEISTEVKHLELQRAGVVILKKGDLNIVSFKYLPKKETMPTCGRNGDKIILGSNQGSSSYNTVFNVTYKDQLPDIKITGNGMVRVMGPAEGQTVFLDLSDDSKCVIESLRANSVRIKQSGMSQLLLSSLVTTDLDVWLEEGSEANLMGLSVGDKIVAKLQAPARDEDRYPLLRMDGRTKLLDASLGYHAKLDALNCSAATVYLAVHPYSFITQVYVKDYLLVKPYPKIRQKVYEALDVSARVEYAGVPRRIKSQCDISMAPSRTSSVLSWVAGKVGDTFGVRVDPTQVTDLISDKINQKIGQKLGISAH
ncbi:hypothetical protein FJ366_01870 [Candidatus Dependentiae bacterium]|nr:hypothetical protein [Candidatus Dependentiae bacterium]